MQLSSLYPTNSGLTPAPSVRRPACLASRSPAYCTPALSDARPHACPPVRLFARRSAFLSVCLVARSCHRPTAYTYAPAHSSQRARASPPARLPQARPPARPLARSFCISIVIQARLSTRLLACLPNSSFIRTGRRTNGRTGERVDRRASAGERMDCRVDGQHKLKRRDKSLIGSETIWKSSS